MYFAEKEFFMFEHIKNGDFEGVKKEIESGSDVNAKDDFGSTPLDSAVYDWHKDIAALLIANGANPYAIDDDGATPLHLAADRGQKDIVELLISKGGDVNARDDDETTPLYITIEEGHTEITALLRKHGAKTSEELKALGLWNKLEDLR